MWAPTMTPRLVHGRQASGRTGRIALGSLRCCFPSWTTNHTPVTFLMPRTSCNAVLASATLHYLWDSRLYLWIICWILQSCCDCFSYHECVLIGGTEHSQTSSHQRSSSGARGQNLPGVPPFAERHRPFLYPSFYFLDIDISTNNKEIVRNSDNFPKLPRSFLLLAF